MKTSYHIIAALLSIGAVAGTAQAQSVDQRHYDQQHRINQGIRSGRLTPGEAYRAQRQQNSINRQESRMRYNHDGRLTGHDRAVLQHRENRASNHIYNAKHNGRNW